jgi:hypothetical protein
VNDQENHPETPDSGLLCLLMMARLHDIAADPHQLRHEFGREPFSIQTLLLAARKLGLSARCVRQDPARLERMPLPAIAVDRDGKFFLIGKIDRSQAIWRILVQRPGERPAIMLRPAFDECWSGQVIFATSKASFAGSMSKFDFTWFIPAVVKYRKALGEVLLISLMLQLIGLCTPLFFQVVMDKVLVNHAMKTLNVIAVGLIAATLQDQRRAGEHSKLLKLVAPVSGTVQQLNVHTVGGVVPAAQPLMQIVPQEAAVEVEAFLENKDIGFVQVGQDAKVKIEAFDYTRYGTVPATVRHVSHDAIEDEKRGLIYASKIVLSRHTLAAEGRTLALAPGMSVTVEIRTGTRRVIEYVLSPLIRHQQESLNER